MHPTEIVAACDRALKRLFPDLPRPEQKTLAAVVPAVVHRGTTHLARLGAAMAGRATNPSKARRVQRLLANPRLDLARAQRRVIAHVLRHRRGRLDLALDATLIGATTRSPRTGVVTLMLAMAWRGRALPLAWCCLPEQGVRPGQWMPAIRRVVQRVAAELPPGLEVVVLTDRGLSGATLRGILAEVGWHFIQRVTVRPNVRLEDGTIVSVGSLVPRPGCRRVLTGVQLWAVHAVQWRDGRNQAIRHWENAPRLQVVAVWRRTDPEPWLLVTDLPATLARCEEYRRRSWEEALFRDLKGSGWRWDECRLRRPERVERLLLLLVLATLWMLALGQRVLKKGWRRLLEPSSRRELSQFQLGLRWIERCQTNAEPIPVTFRLLPSHQAAQKTVMD